MPVPEAAKAVAPPVKAVPHVPWEVKTFKQFDGEGGYGANILLTMGYTKLRITTWAMGCGVYVLDNVASFLQYVPVEHWPALKAYLKDLSALQYRAQRYVMNLPESYTREGSGYRNACLDLLFKEKGFSKVGSSFVNNAHTSAPNQLYMWDLTVE